MEVKQIYSLINSVSGEVLGKTDIVSEDLKLTFERINAHVKNRTCVALAVGFIEWIKNRSVSELHQSKGIGICVTEYLSINFGVSLFKDYPKKFIIIYE